MAYLPDPNAEDNAAMAHAAGNAVDGACLVILKPK